MDENHDPTLLDALVQGLNGDDLISPATGYPSQWSLKTLRTFAGPPRILVEDILMPSFGRMGVVTVEDHLDQFKHQVKRVFLATGGWSGNESMIAALDWDFKTMWSSFFWFAYWESSHRGGGYHFHVPADKWDKPMPIWLPRKRDVE